LFFGFVSVNSFAQSSTNDQRIVGTWIWNDGNDTFTYVFNANGSGTFTYTGTISNLTSGTFTYGISLTGEIYISDQGDTRGLVRGSEKIYFSPDGKTMMIRGGVFRKK